LSVEVLYQALQLAPVAYRPDAGRVLGYQLNQRELRFGLERSYRTMAKVSHDRATRTALVDLANTVRPRTLI
jgi:serine/threonine-protein kinase PknG